jgi:hypothetical protein
MLLKNSLGSISLTKVGIWIAVVVATALTTMSQFTIPQSLSWITTFLQILFIVGLGIGGIGARNAIDKLGIDVQSIIPWLKRASNNVTEAKLSNDELKKQNIVYLNEAHEQKIIDKLEG